MEELNQVKKEFKKQMFDDKQIAIKTKAIAYLAELEIEGAPYLEN